MEALLSMQTYRCVYPLIWSSNTKNTYTYRATKYSVRLLITKNATYNIYRHTHSHIQYW